MANRVTVPVTNFETLSPPWSLASLDSDLLALQGGLNDSSLGYVNTGTDTGSANNYVISTPSFGAFSAYNQGATVLLIPANTNTGASTLNVNGLGAVAIINKDGSALTAGTLVVNHHAFLVYAGTAFRLVNQTFGGVLYSTAFTNSVSGSYQQVTGWALAGSAGVTPGFDGLATFTINSVGVAQLYANYQSGVAHVGAITMTPTVGNMWTATANVSSSTAAYAVNITGLALKSAPFKIQVNLNVTGITYNYYLMILSLGQI